GAEQLPGADEAHRFEARGGERREPAAEPGERDEVHLGGQPSRRECPDEQAGEQRPHEVDGRRAPGHAVGPGVRQQHADRVAQRRPQGAGERDEYGGHGTSRCPRAPTSTPAAAAASPESTVASPYPTAPAHAPASVRASTSTARAEYVVKPPSAPVPSSSRSRRRRAWASRARVRRSSSSPRRKAPAALTARVTAAPW